MWSIDLIWGLSIAILIALTCIGVILGTHGMPTHEFQMLSESALARRIAIPILVLTVVATGLFTYPWHAEYHQYDLKGGTVSGVVKRLQSSGDGMDEGFVFTIDGDEYFCNDNRCSGVDVGEPITLRCIRVWEYHATDWWSCQFVAHGKQP